MPKYPDAMGVTKVMDGSTDEVSADRAARLFTYVREIARLQTKVIGDFVTSSAYEERLWLGELPDDPMCKSIVRNDPVHPGEWLSVDRPQFTTPPQVPEELEPWLNPASVRNSAKALTINEHATISVEIEMDDGSVEVRSEQQNLEGQPEVGNSFDSYRDRWQVWAAEDQRLQPIHDVYSTLYQIHQRSADLVEIYEVAVGIGVLTKRTDRRVLRRPLLVARADIEFDEDSGRLTLGPAGDGMDLHFEDEMVDEGDRPDISVTRNLESRLADVDDPFEPDAIDPVLKAWANASGTTARYEATLEQPLIEETVVVSYSPVLVLRRRTRRAVVDFCDRIIAQLEEGVPELTDSVRDIIELSMDHDPPNDDEGSGEGVGPELLFPLPANDEQREIVERLANANGLVVEGPPGTGKSHTIANLIAHLTANGERVLVTSHTARALTVLKHRLPDGVADLCVDVLGEGRERRDNLERSVKALLARHTDPDWDVRRITKRLAAKVEDRDRTRERRAEMIEEQRRARRFEVQEHDPGIAGFSGFASSIAAKVRLQRGRWVWFEDDPSGPPPAELSDGPAMLAAQRSTSESDEAAAALVAPSPDEIPAPTAVRGALEDIGRLKARAGELTMAAESLARAVADADGEKRDVLLAGLEKWTSARSEVRSRKGEWIADALYDLSEGQDRKWMQLEKSTESAIARIEANADGTQTQVVGVTDLNRTRIRLQAQALLDHLKAGGAIRRFGRTSPPARQANELLNSVTVNGRRPDHPGELEELLSWIDVEAELEGIFTAWAGNLQAQSDTVTGHIVALKDQLDDLQSVLAVDKARRSIDAANKVILGVDSPDWSNESETNNFVDSVRHGQALAAADDAMRLLNKEAAQLHDMALQEGASPSVQEAIDAIATSDATAYAAAFSSLEALAEIREKVRRRDDLGSRVRRVAPRTMDALMSSPMDEAWDERMSSLAEAWEWKRADAWLKESVKARDEASIGRDLHEADERLLRLTGEIAEHLAWQSAIGRLSREAQQNLRAYQAAMKNYGKGTGKNAQRHLRDARQYLEACQDAVPVWIMPTHVVAETVLPKPGAFDVIIIDEASQSGVEAAFLFWLGKKVIVVGDDRQISPDSVGIDRTAAERLADTYLSDFRLKSVLGVDNSLFTQATVRYQQRIRLREHFRCMPEIIEFSNKIAYQDQPLIPLRQYGAERLEPLVARFVEGAETSGSSGSKRNEREAEQVISTIKRLIDDPEYAGKSMGIVSMLGIAQARLIESLLIREIPAKEIAKRKIRSGDAYAFQGDERDVMFLSLVVTPSTDGSAIRVATERTFLQRYNVACSRARDQEWLFHSVELSDLKTYDLRHQLLAHFVAPTREDLEQELNDVPDDHRVDPFDSVFEQLVYKDIRRRGYRVQPQVHVHDYRIDLVVVGRDRKLAVECDGNQWHGPERYAADQARQRDLERCGWTFVRIRGSDYFGDPSKALEPLWQRLTEYEIYPVGEDPRDRDDSGDVELGRQPDASDGDGIEPEQSAAGEEAAGGGVSASDFSSDWTGSTSVAPYVAWTPGSKPPLPGEHASAAVIAEALCELIETEGPIEQELMLKRYVKATGRRRVTDGLRRPLLDALGVSVDDDRVSREIVTLRKLGMRTILRRAGNPPIAVRERGSRKLVEIPPNEVAAAMVTLSTATGNPRGESLKRETLRFYGRRRLTEQASEYLDECIALMGDTTARATGAALALNEHAVQPSRAHPPAEPAESVGRGAADSLPIPEEDEGVATPSFWEVVLSTVRDSKLLPPASAETLSALWEQADADEGIDELRSEASRLGAEEDWSAVARFVASNLEGYEPEYRGAVVDIAYLEYLLQSGVALPEVSAWPGRLGEAWRVALADTRDQPQVASPVRLCNHGEPSGRCMYLACAHHPSGGFDPRSEM